MLLKLYFSSHSNIPSPNYSQKYLNSKNVYAAEDGRVG